MGAHNKYGGGHGTDTDAETYAYTDTDADTATDTLPILLPMLPITYLFLRCSKTVTHIDTWQQGLRRHDAAGHCVAVLQRETVDDLR